MIESELFEIVFSNVQSDKIFSEEIDDYAALNIVVRITENSNERITEADQNRILE